MDLDADDRLPTARLNLLRGHTAALADAGRELKSARRSTALATLKSIASPRAGPITWNPMGRPPSSRPIGTDIAG